MTNQHRRGNHPKALFRGFHRKIPFSNVLAETLYNTLAALVALVFGAILLSNSVFQFSLFTQFRNWFVSDQAVYSRMANVWGIAIDDEVLNRQEEADLVRRGANPLQPARGAFEPLADALGLISGYARNPNSAPTRIVVGIDYVFSTMEDPSILEPLVEQLSNLEENTYVVLGAMLNTAGTYTAYFRYDIYRDIIGEAVRKKRGSDYVAKHLFTGNLGVVTSPVVSGFDETSDTQVLGYTPVVRTSGSFPVFYGSLAAMMNILGKTQSPGDLWVTQDGYLDANCNLVDTKAEAGFRSESDDLNGLVRLNWLSGKDLTVQPLLKSHYLPLSRISSKYSTTGQDSPDLANLISNRFKVPDGSSEKPASPSETQYFFLFRVQSSESAGEDASSDVFVTPASNRDPFSRTFGKVSGVMAHITALSNLQQKEFIVDTPEVFNFGAVLVLAALCLWIGLRAEFRTIVLWTLGLFVGILAFSFALFLFHLFFDCRWALIVSLGILIILAAVRFLVTRETRGAS